MRTVLFTALAIAASVPGYAETSEQCLAKAIYYEARGESYQAKLAVAKVVVNRTQHPSFPAGVCAVVYQPGQFSWSRNRQLQHQRREPKPWQQAQQIAQWALDAPVWGRLEHFNATHFHNNTVAPTWNFVRVAKIGKHTFYVERLPANPSKH